MGRIKELLLIDKEQEELMEQEALKEISEHMHLTGFIRPPTSEEIDRMAREHFRSMTLGEILEELEFLGDIQSIDITLVDGQKLNIA